jgi:PAS domain S-box-containing protein
MLRVAPQTLRRWKLRQRTGALGRAVARIHEHERFLEKVLEEVGYWEWDVRSGRAHWSDQLCRMLGWEPGAVEPSLRAFSQRLHPDDRDGFARALRRQLSGRGGPGLDLRVVLDDGGQRTLHALLELEQGKDGRARRLRGTVQDVTERRNTEEAFRQAQKMESLGVLAGGIAHDFNNLLSAIGGNLELARMHLQPDQQAIPFLNRIEKILRRAAELTHQMLAYSGKGRLLVSRLDLNHLAEEMPHLLEVSISKRVRLEYRLAPELAPIEADAAQVQQVIMNLVTNASEAIGDQDGAITLTTGVVYLENPQEQLETHGWKLVPGLYVFLEVADTGCGMNAETRKRLFDPFFTTKFSGRGLGLSAMLGILKGHNAGIRIRSRVGEGSSFTVFFPACVTGDLAQIPRFGQQQDRAPLGAFGAEECPVGRERRLGAAGTPLILLVDDEPDILDATAELLVGMEFQVVLAQDGREAVERVRSHPGRFSLVLMDLTMPHMDGREAFQAIRALEPGLKVVLCSGFNEADALQGQGLAGFLQKPYTSLMLKEVVSQALVTS